MKNSYEIDDDHIMFKGVRYKKIPNNTDNCELCALRPSKCVGDFINFLFSIGYGNACHNHGNPIQWIVDNTIEYTVKSIADNRSDDEKELADLILG